MANTIQVLRGLSSNRLNVTPAIGEFLYTTDDKNTYMGDGSTPGGVLLTGTASTISDFDTEVSNNTDVAANTSARHTHTNEATLDLIDQDVSADGTPNFDSIQLNGGVSTQGTVSWNTDEETLDLIQNSTVLQLGQETQIHCRNNTVSTITNGTVVMATGTLGASGRITIAPYDGTSPVKYILGVATADIAVDADGKVTNFGKVRGLNTSSWTEGDVLYATSAGGLTNVEPVTGVNAPMAFVINSHLSTGTVMVRFTPIDENEFQPYDVNIVSDADYVHTDNNYTTSDKALVSSALQSETLTTLSLATNILTYVDENGTSTNLDLSLYLDDTNLAYLTSGTINGSTGIATFTRSDATTFDVDMSALLDDTTITVNDTLISISTTEALSANQGKVLKDILDTHNHSGTYEPSDSDIVKAPSGVLPILDGSNLTDLDALPDQTSNDGKYLTTDGTTASWADPATGDVYLDGGNSGTSFGVGDIIIEMGGA